MYCNKTYLNLYLNRFVHITLSILIRVLDVLCLLLCSSARLCAFTG